MFFMYLLNPGGWKFSGIPALLDVIANNCVELRALNLTGWQGLHIEHISFLVTSCQKLQKLDLSGVNVSSQTFFSSPNAFSVCSYCYSLSLKPEAHNNKGAVSLSSMQHLTSVMGDRLTHLVLANNKLAGVPQIIQAIAVSQLLEDSHELSWFICPFSLTDILSARAVYFMIVVSNNNNLSCRDSAPTLRFWTCQMSVQ